MIEALLFISTGSLLILGSAAVIITALVLRKARRYVELAELRMERLSQGQAYLLALLGEGHQVPEEVSEQRRNLAKERERSARRTTERRIEQLERELRQLRGVRGDNPTPVVAESVQEHSKVRRPAAEEASVAWKTETTSRPAKLPETTARKSPTVRLEDGRSRRGVLVPHPDDGAEVVGAPAVQARARGGAPVEMFRKHYDKYLENYRGYVELAEGLYRMRDAGGIPPGPAECEWEEKLRRVEGGIKRTTARMDILEGHNTELVADNDRVSRRASIARRYSEIQGTGGADRR